MSNIVEFPTTDRPITESDLSAVLCRENFADCWTTLRPCWRLTLRTDLCHRSRARAQVPRR
jgi:hypothetical protein